MADVTAAEYLAQRERIVKMIAALADYNDPVFPIIRAIGGLNDNATAHSMLRHLDAKLRSFGSATAQAATVSGLGET